MALNKRSLGSLALVLGLGCVLAMIGRWMLFTTFMIYDDEGYVLYSLRNYIVHGDLYTRVYSQYGPFFYNFYDMLQRVLPLEYDNVSGRWITLINWMTTVGASGLLVWRYSRSLTHTLFVMGMTFFCLWVMVSEPIHPGGLLTALVALGTVIGAIMIERERPMSFAVSGALIGIALLLTKINVGVFFLTSVGGWMLINSAYKATGRLYAKWLVALGCALLPFLLMQSLWGSTSTRIFALIVATSALSLVMLLNQSRRPEHSSATWIGLIGVGTAWAFLIGLLTWMRGTGWIELVQGVILNPLKHPGVYSLPLVWKAASLPLAIGSFALALWLYTRKTYPASVSTVIAGLRFVILVFFLMAGQVSMGRFGQLYGIPLIWLLVVPLTPDAITGRDRARLWIGWVLVFQSLHAYPVAGSQINWGTFLFPALLGMGVYEALVYIKKLQPTLGRGLAILSGATMMIHLVSLTYNVGKTSAGHYYESPSLKLHGAEQVRMSNDFTDTLQIISGNLKLYANTLFSFPGLYSMNIWTGKPTPTLENATHWFTLLTLPQQQAIIDRLEADPNACVVVQCMIVDFLEMNGFSTKSLLRDYLVREFTPALKLDGYAIWIHKHRTIQLINIISIQQIGPGPRIRLEGIVPIGTETIGRIDLLNYETDPRVIQLIDTHASTTNFTSTPFVPSDIPPSSVAPGDLMRFTVEFTGAFNHLNPHDAFAILKSTDGRELARLRFAH